MRSTECRSQLERGRTLGIVGESGCGKSVTASSIMGIVQPPGKVVGGSVVFDGRELVGRKESELENIRGSEISMIFQDPMTSLNPTLGSERRSPRCSSAT